MLKLFNIKRKITALQLRACLPAVASSGLRNTHILQEFCRSMSSSQNGDEPDKRAWSGVAAEGKFYIWSLTSSHGESLMRLHKSENHDPPEIRCDGKYTSNFNVVEINDVSASANVRTISLRLSLREVRYYLSVDRKDKVVMKEISSVENNQRFIQWEYRGFLMFESFKSRGGYLGCKDDGSLDLIYVYHMPQPDPRALFLIHAKNPRDPHTHF